MGQSQISLGVVYPNNELEVDTEIITEYCTKVEKLGYDDLIMNEHILGIDYDQVDWSPTYNYNIDDQFNETFTTLGYLSSITEDINLYTGVQVLPQRQTVLVAKQAAQIDVLSGGRFQFGIGVGWNHAEYEALGVNFSKRGEIIESQIPLLRELWKEEVVNYEDDWHSVTHAGIRPMPIQRPIPIWIGGDANVVLDRAARIGDGWMAVTQPPEALEEKISLLEGFLSREDRNLKDFNIMGRIYLGPSVRYDFACETPDEWLERYHTLVDLGINHIALDTRFAGLNGYEEHLDIVTEFYDVIETTDH